MELSAGRKCSGAEILMLCGLLFALVTFSVRLHAFFISMEIFSFSWAVPIVLSFVIFCITVLFRRQTCAFLAEYCLLKHHWAWLAFPFCGVVTFLFENMLLDEQIRSTVVTGWVRLMALLGSSILLCLAILLFLSIFCAVLRLFTGLCRRLTFTDLCFYVALLVVVNVATYIYMQNSYTVYFWDNAGYWTTANSMAASGGGLYALLREVFYSVLNNDYNELVALPAAMLSYLFGPSRSVFIFGIVNLSVFPTYVLIVMLLKKARFPRLTASCVILSVPYVMKTALIGFIDLAGLPILLFALVAYLRFGKRDLRFIMLSGILFAWAVLLRRWYGFFFSAALLMIIADCIFFRKSAKPFFAAVVPGMFLLLFFAQPLVSEKLLADYSGIYAAYELGLSADYFITVFYYGILILLAALASLIWMVCRKNERRVGVLLLTQMVFCYLLFVRVQTHGQQHLLLYTPVIILALSSLYDKVLSYFCNKKAVLCAVVALSMVPSLSPFIPRTQPGSISEMSTNAALPIFSFYPEVNQNADTLVAINRWLDINVGEKGDTVAVLASSFIINHDILLNTEDSLNIKPLMSDRSYRISLPQVDLRDGFPFDLFDCDYVVLADPIQTHLDPDTQQCVVLPAEEFLSGTGIAAAYEKLDVSFTLMGNEKITVDIYHRVRAVTAAEKQELISKFAAKYPNQESLWQK